MGNSENNRKKKLLFQNSVSVSQCENTRVCAYWSMCANYNEYGICVLKVSLLKAIFLVSPGEEIAKFYMNHLVGKPTMWFPNRSGTKRAVQAQKIAIGLKFRI